MGLVIKESIKSTITTFFGALLGLVTMALSIHFFSQEEYGFYQTIVKNSSILAYVFILGFDYSLLIIGQRYADDDPRRGAFLRYTLLIPLLLFTVALIPYLIFKNQILKNFDTEDIAYYQDYYYHFPIITFLYLILYWFLGFLRSKNKTSNAYFIQDIIIRLGNIGFITLFATGIIDYNIFILGLLISLLIPVMSAIKLVKKESGFTLHSSQRLEKKERLHILEFSFYHMMVVLASMMIFHIDSFLFPYINPDGLKFVGVFSLSLYIISVIRMPLRVVGQSATPTLTRYYDENNSIKLKELFTRSSLSLQLLGSLMCVLVLVNIHEIQWLVNSWTSGYDSLTKIVPILLIGVWIEMCLGINFEMMGISKYYKYTFWISCVYFIISVITFIFLAQYWELVGAAWAFTLSLIAFSLSKSIFVIKKLDLNPFSTNTLKVIALTALALLTYFLPTLIHPFVSIIVKLIVIGSLFIVLSLLWNIGEDVKHLYEKLIKRKIV